MSDNRRAFVPGGCYFFTVVTHARRQLFDQAENVDRLREGFRRAMEKHPFKIDAIVILPDHLHTIWRLPENDFDFSLRWRLMAEGATLFRPTRICWEHVMQGEDDWRNHVDYVHFNPVKHGYVRHSADWRWSSFERASRRGWYPTSWGELVPPNLCGMDFE